MLGSPRVGLHFPALWNLKAASSDFLGTHGVREFKKIKYWDSDGQTLGPRSLRGTREHTSGNPLGP